MNSLFTQASLHILESLSFTKTLYAFDYDGTLAPIVKDPRQAILPKSTWKLLSLLGEVAPVAIVSGRSLEDLKTRVPAHVQYLIGNHGLEGIPRTRPVAGLKEQAESWKRHLETRLVSVTSELGISIEDKEYSLAVHYRRSRKKKIARQAIQEALKDLEGSPKILLGKLVFNIIPPEGPHKGMALTRLMQECGASFAFYIGDDLTDEDVFELRDPKLLTTRIGNKSWSQANYFVSKQTDIDRLLEYILKFRGVKG